ncbi:MAG: DUF547 domain-containing protein [Alphaproteobacteria bacterium]|nr:DUF547 domain-containing protein [Alphaproteobacteria bacterium]
MFKMMIRYIIVACYLFLPITMQAQEAMQFFMRDGHKDSPIDYSHYENFLEKYMTLSANGVSYFDYKNINTNGHQLLKNQIRLMEGIFITNYNQRTQLGYWLNLYNIIVLDEVLNNYPIDNIRDIRNIFTDKKVTIQNLQLSLDDIEHKIIRPIFKDYRIHAALNVASISSGRLMVKAYGYNVNQELQDAMAAWLKRPDIFRIEGNNIHLVRAFDWYIEDFGNSESAMLNTISQHLIPSENLRLQRISNKKIIYDYNWSLNDKASNR